MKRDAKTFTHACILEAQIETNVPQGGDAGHGGKTTLTLRDEGGFAFADNAEQVTITALGDAEAEVLADALAWTGQRLREMIRGTVPF